MKDFFISYTGEDRAWAEWIAWTLEEAGYLVVIQAWDFRPGGNFVLDMQRAMAEASRTIAVLSLLYLQKPFPQSEWAAAFAQDPTSQERKLLPVRVEDCNPPGILRQIVHIDIFDCNEAEAQQRLLSAVKDGRMKPQLKPIFPVPQLRPSFPGKVFEQRQVPERVPFPTDRSTELERPPKPPKRKVIDWISLGLKCVNWLLWLGIGNIVLASNSRGQAENITLTFAMLGILAGAIDGLVTGLALQRSNSSIQRQSFFLLVTVGGAIVGTIWAFAGHQKSNPLTGTEVTVFAMFLGAMFCEVTVWVIGQKLLKN
ncbi:toll/interleukin-1 receptor domain-containing protein [Phormidesmis sp. 146-33]